jgi:hypothetical protein
LLCFSATENKNTAIGLQLCCYALTSQNTGVGLQLCFDVSVDNNTAVGLKIAKKKDPEGSKIYLLVTKLIFVVFDLLAQRNRLHQI